MFAFTQNKLGFELPLQLLEITNGSLRQDKEPLHSRFFQSGWKFFVTHRIIPPLMYIWA